MVGGYGRYAINVSYILIDDTYIYICMYVCTYVRTYVCMYACMYVCMHAWMYVCISKYIYVYTVCITVQREREAKKENETKI